MTANPQTLPYRPCVGIMLKNAEGKVFVAQRIDTRTEAWQMPQGGIDEGESPLEAALRELGEEIGTHKAKVVHALEEWYHYDLPEALVPTVWGGKFRGQKQKWFLMQFEGVDADINIETETPEFNEWRWTDPADLPAVIVPFKRQLYTELVKAFAPYF